MFFLFCISQQNTFALQVSTSNNPNEERKLNITTTHRETSVDGKSSSSTLGTVHFEVLQLLDANKYDNVYNKVPVAVSTNWNELTASTGDDQPLSKLRPKVILDVQIPQVLLSASIPMGAGVRRDASSSGSNLKKPSASHLEVRVDALNVTAVLGGAHF
jgi:hypothetical protein